MSENKKATDTPLYYPRKMRTGWCVAHEVTAAGITIERYGIHCQTYAEAYRRAEVMNRKQQVETEAGLAKLSLVGIGMRSHSGVGATAFKALADANIKTGMISTSEIKIAVMVDESDIEEAARVVHKAFNLGA